jgi:ribose transport system ATP-binding protein
MPEPLVLEMQRIGKSFSGVRALDEVDFDLRRGEVHILLGENGAGKSTLMKILSGAVQKNEGRIFLDGQEIEIKSPKRAQELGVAAIYQELNLVPQLSAAENIFLGREPALAPGVIDRRRMKKDASELLQGLGVEIDVRRPVRDHSIAIRQMVEVAKAISLDAKILILDEPTSALTSKEIKELFARIRTLKAAGVSMVYISHRMEELFEIGDRVTVLRDGRNAGSFRISEVSKADLIKAMVNRELSDQIHRTPVKPGDELLRVENLHREGVLRDISFSLRRGEVLGIAGLLGSGRTELARALFGLDRIDGGRILIKGKPSSRRSPRASINAGVGFLTEDRKSEGLVLGLSVKNNICLPNIAMFSKFGFVRARAETAAAGRYREELRIKCAGIDQRVSALSGGNQQKTALGKWLCSEADLLIFDEPTRGVDVGSKAEIYQLINRLTAAGTAVLMISSELPEILGMSDRILVMHQGAIAGEFRAEDATQEAILRCALGGDGSRRAM